MESLIDVLKSDTEKGMRRLFDEYYKSLVISSFLILSDEIVAEDVVQDFFYNFLKNKSYSALTESTLKAYLYISVRNLSIDLKRKKCRYTEVVMSEVDIPEIDAYDGECDEQTILRIKDEINKLPPKTRRVVEDLVFNQMRYKDISEKNDVSLNTVKTLLKSGLKTIRLNLKKKYQYFFYAFFTHFLSLFVL